MWKNWVNGILGLWLIVSTFFGMSTNGMAVNLVIVGIVVAVLSFAGLASGSYEQTHQHA
jgi:uncharacterized membrane protein